MVHVYWIRLQDEFTSEIFGPTLRVGFTGQAYGSSIFVMFTTLGYCTNTKKPFNVRYFRPLMFVQTPMSYWVTSK